MQKIYLIDGSAYIYRAYHAITPLTTSKGLTTHAILGFVNMIHRLLKEHDPSYIAIAFDSKGPVFRHQLYSDYKANRPPMPEDLREQIPYIKKFVTTTGIILLEQQGVEADDILATLTRHFSEQGHSVILVSGDKDLLQLVDKQVKMYDPMKEKEFGITEVEKKYGVTVRQLLDYFSLVGDSSDNVPGIPGIGPKTAAKLIDQYGSLEGLYQNISAMKKSKMKEKIISNREQAFLSRALIDLKYDVELPKELDAYCLNDCDSNTLRELYTELEFSSLLKSVDRSEKINPEHFSVIHKEKELHALKAELDAAELLVIDTETTSLNARKAKLVGISLCTSLERAYYIPVGHKREDGSLQKDQLNEKEVLAFLRPWLTGTPLKIAHNLKYDYTVLQQGCGLTLSGPMADTLIAAHLCEMGRSLKLDDLCLSLGIKMTAFSEVVKGDKREDCFAYVDIETAGKYSCEDVYGTLLLWHELEPQLREKNLQKIFFEVEMPILPILAAMETAGICIDASVLDSLRKEFTTKLASLEKEIHTLAGQEFNIGSPKQLGNILFDKLGLPHGRKTKTGYSTDIKVLEKLAKRHQLPALVLEYRSFAKLLSTYVEKLSQLQENDGRVHTTFNQAVTATGRLSSTDPNLQNIPIRSEEGGRIRQAFVPKEGQVFLSADYSQIDLRVLAVYSQDSALLEALQQGKDIHNRTAAEIFGVDQLMINAEMRRVAKSINFGIVYGMSAFGLSSQLDIPRKDAQRFIDRYFGLYTGVQDFMKTVVEQAKTDGYVSTLLGRRRSLPDLQAKNRNQREFAERMAINTPIQGSAADIIKLAMIACEKAVAKTGLHVTMLLQIHDELVFELPEKEVEQAKPVLKKAMEQVLPLDVPLVVNFTIGSNLAK